MQGFWYGAKAGPVTEPNSALINSLHRIDGLFQRALLNPQYLLIRSTFREFGGASEK